MYFSDSLSLLTGLKETKWSKFSCLRKQHNIIFTPGCKDTMWRKFSDIRPLDVTGAVSWNYQNLNSGNHHQTGWDIKVSVHTWKEGIIMQQAQKEPWMDKAVTETDCNHYNIVFLENLLASNFQSSFLLFVTFDKLWCFGRHTCLTWSCDFIIHE